MANTDTKSKPSEAADRLKASALGSPVGLHFLRTTVKAGSKNKSLPKSARKQLKALVPVIKDAEKAAKHQRSSRKASKARKQMITRLRAELEKGTNGVKKAKAAVKA
jgi:hypothetical protein